MKIKNIVRAFTASLVVCTLAGAQVVRQQSTSEDPESLRRMLANQPDHTAVRWDFLSIGDATGGAAKGKMVKMGDKLAEVWEHVIIIREPGKPTIKVFPESKEYAEVTAEEKDDYGAPPEELTNPEKVARRDDAVFRSAGVEEVGGYTCLKIEVSPKDKKLKGVKLLFWVAPTLKNLVIQSEVSVTRPQEGQVKYTTLLQDISLVVNEELFRVPPGYKKVSEPSPLKGARDKIREPR